MSRLSTAEIDRTSLLCGSPQGESLAYLQAHLLAGPATFDGGCLLDTEAAGGALVIFGRSLH